MDEGAVVYDAPCNCGNPPCGDELVLSPTRDRLTWTRRWGSGDHYDKWVLTEDDIQYVWTVDQDGFRYPPVMPE
jgi:hypothetical protein